MINPHEDTGDGSLSNPQKDLIFKQAVVSIPNPGSRLFFLSSCKTKQAKKKERENGIAFLLPACRSNKKSALAFVARELPGALRDDVFSF